MTNFTEIFETLKTSFAEKWESVPYTEIETDDGKYRTILFSDTTRKSTRFAYVDIFERKDSFKVSVREYLNYSSQPITKEYLLIK